MTFLTFLVAMAILRYLQGHRGRRDEPTTVSYTEFITTRED